jgi:hypothetical protein
MRLTKKLLGLAMVATAGVGLMMGPVTAASPINGTGTVTCGIKGTIKFSPPLKTGGTSPETVSISASLSGCSGTGNGADVVKASSKGSESTPNNDCASLAGTMSNTLTTTTKWTVGSGKPKLNPSTVVFTSETGNAGPPLSFDASGSATAGSFAGDSAAAHAVIKQTISQVFAACGSAKGLKSLSIVATGSSSSLS